MDMADHNYAANFNSKIGWLYLPCEIIKISNYEETTKIVLFYITDIKAIGVWLYYSLFSAVNYL